MLTGQLQTNISLPHLHDTYTIAFMKSGTAAVRVRDTRGCWTSGSLFLANPYEVHEGGSCGPGELLDYEVIYPSVELVLEALGLSGRNTALPRFSPVVVDAPAIAEQLHEILCESARLGSSSAADERLIRFLRSNHDLFRPGEQTREVAAVAAACRILREAVDATQGVTDLAAQVGMSRHYFIRLFHRVTGLAPGAYLRQLQLSKARRLICAGQTLAQAAVESNFADQPHLTREFKRIFGTTPGMLARDLAAQGAVRV